MHRSTRLASAILLAATLPAAGAIAGDVPVASPLQVTQMEAAPDIVAGAADSRQIELGGDRDAL